MARRRYQQGSIRLRGKKWTLRWREDVVQLDGTTARVEKTTTIGTIGDFPTRRLARRQADVLLARVNCSSYRPSRVATFQEFAARWQQQVGQLLKPSTANVALSHLRCHLVPAFGRLRLDQIELEEVQVFVTKLAKTHGRHTVTNILSTLFTVMKAAKKWGYQVTEARRADLVIPNDRPSRPGRFFLPEQVKAILALAKEPWKTVFSVAAMTGLRPGEVLGLSVDDLDFKTRQIFVRRSVWYGRVHTPKSKSSIAPVPMPETLAAILAKFLESWTPNEQRLLFVNRVGRAHSANKVVQRKLWPILDALGIPRCGMHAFRHSLGTALSSTGASVKTIQTQLRHASSAVTLEKYVHPIPWEQREALEKAIGYLRSDVAKSETNASPVN
jgi:integrase